ncbi:MAG: hypothetical protein F4X05_02855, partial [Rhodothermaceae bacterium]|nr:hypothetical protein [Rhodothermaceae bacterium]
MIRTYLLLTLAVFCTAPVTSAKGQDAATVHKALTALYESTNGGQWKNNVGWDTTTVPATIEGFDSWYGLRVIYGNLNSIDLSHNHLTGSIPPELGNLTELQSLRLSDNQLTGSIPSEFGKLTELWLLHLRRNQLTGSIPPELGNLTGLGSLNLDYNRLTGSIPPELGNL